MRKIERQNEDICKYVLIDNKSRGDQNIRYVHIRAPTGAKK